MDERLLFEKFHEALDVDPRPAAYERLRSALIAKTSTPRRRAAFQMRWTRMGFRFAAAVVLVAIAATAGAVFFATHRVAEREIPAALDANSVAYQRLISVDDNAVVGSESNHCGDITDAGCPAAANRLITALQRWLDDVDRYSTPPAFTTIDAQVRVHLNAAIADLNDAVVAQQAKNQPALTAAVQAAGQEADWLSAASVSIGNARPSTSAAYEASVREAKAVVDGCSYCQQLVMQPGASCSPSLYPSCDLELMTAKQAVAQAQDDLVITIAPVSLHDRDSKLQADLARADTALVDLRKALRTGDLAGWDAARSNYGQALTGLKQD